MAAEGEGLVTFPFFEHRTLAEVRETEYLLEARQRGLPVNPRRLDTLLTKRHMNNPPDEPDDLPDVSR